MKGTVRRHLDSNKPPFVKWRFAVERNKVKGGVKT